MFAQRFLSIIALVIIFPIALMAQQSGKGTLETKFGKGIRYMSADSSLYTKFELRIQPLMQGTYDFSKDTDPFGAEAMIRRARLKFSGYVWNPAVEYKVELGLSNRDIGVRGSSSDYANIILDAYARIRLCKYTKLRVGQFKLPGNRERVVSSGSLQTVDRSLVNGTFNIDRDAGFMFENKFEFKNQVFINYLSVSQGEGRNRLTKDSGFLYAARLEYLPFGAFHKKGDYVMSAIYREETPKLSIGATYSYNDDAMRAGGTLRGALFTPVDIKTLSIDMMFKYGGLSVYSEYANRDAVNPVTMSGDSVYSVVYAGSGFNAQAGYMFKNNWEIAGRYTTLVADEKIADHGTNQTDYTFVVSKYFVGHNLKVQGDVTWSERSPFGDPTDVNQRLIFRLTGNLNF